MSWTIPEQIERRLEGLPLRLREHIARSREKGRSLACIHGVDEQAVDLGLAAHDLARALNPTELLDEAQRLGLEISPVERHAPIMLHGSIAAEWVAREGSISDTDVLEAIRWHTTGVSGMGVVAKVVFLGDKLDPHKIAHTSYLIRVAGFAEVTLDRAILEFLSRQFEDFLDQGRTIHPEGVKLRNELIAVSTENSD